MEVTAVDCSVWVVVAVTVVLRNMVLCRSTFRYQRGTRLQQLLCQLLCSRRTSKSSDEPSGVQSDVSSVLLPDGLLMRQLIARQDKLGWVVDAMIRQSWLVS